MRLKDCPIRDTGLALLRTRYGVHKVRDDDGGVEVDMVNGMCGGEEGMWARVYDSMLCVVSHVF